MKLAVVMDPIEKIIPEKDGTLDLLLTAQDRNYDLTYLEPQDLKIIVKALTLREIFISPNGLSLIPW